MTTFAVIASGPSLTQEQVDHTKHLITIAVNDTWKMVPARIISMPHGAWWDENNHDKILYRTENGHTAKTQAMRYGTWNLGIEAQVYNNRWLLSHCWQLI